MTPKDIIKKSGGAKVVAELVGLNVKVPRDLINRHCRLGKLPASWFAALEAHLGEELPRELFSFKGKF